MANTILKLERISKSFGKNPVLNEVSLSLESGKFYALLGKNGAGKSTLMKIIMRYEQAHSGSGSIFERTLSSDTDQFNEDIGYVSESLDYQVSVNIKTLIAHIAQIHKRWDQALLEKMLGFLGINQENYFKDLSRGQKMQVAFAIAAAMQPKLIVLDEITSVLDANARAYVMNYLGEFRKNGGTVLMATNIVSEVQHFADHIILIDEGKVKLDLPLKELSNSFSKYRKKFGESHAVFYDNACIEVTLNSDHSVSYVIPVQNAATYRVPEELRDHRGITAEEIFIYYTRRAA